MYSPHRTLLFCLLFIFAANSFLFAQQHPDLNGRAVDAATGEPLVNAAIMLEPGSHGVITNRNGLFTLEAIEPGKYALTVTSVGYNTHFETIELKGGNYPFMLIELAMEVKSIEGVEIFADARERQPYMRNVINAETIEKLPVRDIGEYLRSEPNVSGIRKGATNIDPVIRGMKAGQLNVQANGGHKIEGGCPNRMDPSSSHIDPHDITRIEILKGPYALRFGPVFGGVLNISTKKATPHDDFRLNARAIRGWESNWNGNREHISLVGGNRQVFFALSGNNHRYGNYTAGNGEEIKSSFRKYNYSAELGISPSERHEVLFSYKGSHGRDIRFPALAMDEREDNTNLSAVSYRYENPGGSLRSIDLKLYRSEVYHEMDNKWRPFSDTVVAISTVDALTRGGRTDFGIQFREGILQTGFDYEHIYKDGTRVKNLIMQPGLPVKVEPLWQNAHIRNLGFFAEYRQNLNDRLHWIAAARIDRNEATSDAMLLENMMGKPMYYNDTTSSEFFNFSFSTGLMYQLSSSLSVDFALGRGVRNPDMVERFIILLPVGYDRYDYLGNPQLKPEANHQADITINYSSSKAGFFSANGFFSYITDYVTGIRVPPTQVMPQTAGVLGVKRFENIDHAFLYGFELRWRSPDQLKWIADLSAAYTTGINPEAVRHVVENGNVTGSELVKNDPLSEIPPFEANLKVRYKMLKERLIPELNIRMVAAQNRISAAYGEEETPGFAVAGINLFYRYNALLSLSGGVNNIFDTAYYEHLNRRIIGSTSSLYEPGRIFYVNVILNI
jgi:iron complex outermembrane recepter protein